MNEFMPCSLEAPWCTAAGRQRQAGCPSYTCTVVDVSVIAEVPTQGDADEVGVGTVISGLSSASLTSAVLGGVVPSVNTGPVIVLDSGSVEAVPLIEERSTDAVGVGLQNPDMLSMPNVDITGSGAMDGDEDVNPGVDAVLLEATTVVVGVVETMGAALVVVEIVIPVVGHTVIAPRDVPAIGPKVPRLSSMVPNGFPVTPIAGMVPGTAVGVVMGMAVDDVMGVAGVRRVVVDPTCATAVPQPIKTTADIARNKRCIKASLIAVERSLSISDWSAWAMPAPCRRRRG
jgi:hypothetical protein